MIIALKKKLDAKRYSFTRIHVQPGDNVLVPALICKDVVASIHTVGAHPIFYPVDKSLCPVDLASPPRTTAVIAVNYFGFAQDLAIFHE